MSRFMANLSVRVKLSLALGLLLALLVTTLYFLIRTAQNNVNEARELNTVGGLRAEVTQIELLARQIATTEERNAQLIEMMRKQLQTDVNLLHAAARVLNAANPGEAQRLFTAFLAPLNLAGATRQEFHEVSFVGFAPRILGTQRADFETRAAQEGFTGFQIRELDSTHTPVPAADRADYFPLYYAAPLAPHRALLGLDLGAHPAIRPALERSLERVEPAMSAPFSLTGETRDSSVLIVLPIFNAGSVPTDLEARRSNLNGYMTALLNADLLTRSVAANAGNAAIQTVTDITDDQPQVMFKMPLLNGNAPADARAVTLELAVMGRAWEITVAQTIDTPALEMQLQAHMQELSEMIDTLADNGIAHNIYGLEHHGQNVEATSALLKRTKDTLNQRVRLFLNTADSQARGPLLPLLEANARTVYLHLDRLVAELQADFEAANEQSVRSALVVGCLAAAVVLIGALLNYNVMRGLTWVRRGAMRLANGQFDARLNMQRGDEIGQISRTLDAMAEHIQNLFATLSANEAQYRLLAENVADMITRTDVHGVYTYVSPVSFAILGYPPDEMIGTHWRDYIHPDDLADLQLAEQSGDTLSLSRIYRMRRRDGEYVWLEASVRLLPTAGGATEFITVARDITERRAAEEALNQARQEHEQLQQQIIEAQKQAIQELSSPVIPIMNGVIVMPIIGSIDTTRARDITRALLAGISQHRAQIAILDITGVPIVDSGVADHLNRSIQAARLKGTHTIITGISEAVAEAIVDLGIDWRGIETVRDLQTGLKSALIRLGMQVEVQQPYAANGYGGSGHLNGNGNGRPTTQPPAGSSGHEER